MSVPGPSASDAHTQDQPSSLVDLPYSSGDHEAPSSLARCPLPEHTSGIVSQDLPRDDVDHDTSHMRVSVDPNYGLSSGHGAIIPQPHRGTHKLSSDVSTRSNPLRQTIVPGPAEVKSLSSADRTSIISVSQRSGDSWRQAYREHYGPPARAYAPNQDAPVIGPSPASIIPPISADDSRQSGEPLTHYSPLRFYPMSTNGVSQYNPRRSRCQFENDYRVEAMLYQYPETPDGVPEGWMAYRHPEGALYFVHIESKTFTYVNVCDEDIHSDVEHFRTFLFSELEAEIKRRNLSESLRKDEVQLVLEPKLDDLGLMCCYYFVNPRTRSLFWLDEWEGYEIFGDRKGILSLPRKGLGIQAQYWYALVKHKLMFSRRCRKHWELYPNFCWFTQELKAEVVDMILHATCDHLTSNKSSCPISPQELNNHLSLIKQINPETTQKRQHCAIIIGRIMYIFYYSYFLNYQLEGSERPNPDQSIPGWGYHSSLFMKVLTPLFFMAPLKNVRLLHGIFVDDVTSREKWNSFILKLNSQFKETSVLATVLLNVDVAFLPKTSGAGTLPGLQQFLCYMSLVASMASIILSLIFLGRSPTEVNEKDDLDTLAIVYSLPYAFLMWGMCLFSAAFAAQWCYTSNTKLRAGAGAFMFVVAALVVWGIWTARGRNRSWSRPENEGN